jgi:hypothetical protein
VAAATGGNSSTERLLPDYKRRNGRRRAGTRLAKDPHEVFPKHALSPLWQHENQSIHDVIVV